MAFLTPATATILTTDSPLELTSAYADRIWAIASGSGSLGAGSTAYKRLFTPSGAGTVVISAQSPPYSVVNSELTANADGTLTVNSNATSSSNTKRAAKLGAVGDKVTWTHTTAYIAGHIVTNVNGGLLYAFGTVYSFPGIDVLLSSSSSNGDTLSFEIITGNYIAFKRNGTTIYTSTFTVDLSGSNRVEVCFYKYDIPVSTVIPLASITGSGISGITEETATITVNEAPPPDMVLGTPTVVNSGQINVPFTDNAAFNTIKIQRCELNTFSGGTLVEYDNQTADTPWVNNTGLNPASTKRYYYRAKGKKISGTLSDNWSNTVSAEIVYVPPPGIASNSPLPLARVGYPYSFQLTKSGGSGSGTWGAVSGNLPDGTVASNGLITIATVGNSNYSFTVRFTDTNGTYVDKAFTIPVSALALWDTSWYYKRPLQIDYLQPIRVFEPISGVDEVIEDKPEKREFTLQIMFHGMSIRDEIKAFLYEHRLRKSFLFKTENADEYITVKLVKAPSEAQMLTYGGFDVVFREV